MQNQILTKQFFVPEKYFFLRVEVSEISNHYSIFLKRTNVSKKIKKSKSKIRLKLWFHLKKCIVVIGKSILSTFEKNVFFVETTLRAGGPPLILLHNTNEIMDVGWLITKDPNVQTEICKGVFRSSGLPVYDQN